MIHDTTLSGWTVTVSEVCRNDIIRTSPKSNCGVPGALARVMIPNVIDDGETGGLIVQLLVEYGDGSRYILEPKDISRVFWRVDHPTKGASVSAYKFTPKEGK